MYSTQIDIAATPGRVFSMLIDPALLKQWQPAIVEVQTPPGGLRVGASLTGLVQEFGRRFEAHLVVREFEPDRALAYDMTTPAWSGRIEYHVEGHTSGTRLSLLFTPDKPAGWTTGWRRHTMRTLANATRPLVQLMLRRRLKAFRSLVEATV